MEKIIVLTISGKGADVDRCKVTLFDTREEAEDFVKNNDDPMEKYYVHSAIIENNTEYEVYGCDGYSPAYIE